MTIISNRLTGILLVFAGIGGMYLKVEDTGWVLVAGLLIVFFEDD